MGAPRFPKSGASNTLRRRQSTTIALFVVGQSLAVSLPFSPLVFLRGQAAGDVTMAEGVVPRLPIPATGHRAVRLLSSAGPRTTLGWLAAGRAGGADAPGFPRGKTPLAPPAHESAFSVARVPGSFLFPFAVALACARAKRVIILGALGRWHLWSTPPSACAASFTAT